MTVMDTRELHSHGEILIVEDTPASLALLTDLLTRAGYRVRQAPNGELALWTARAQAPELILLDVRMPGMDGYEVCRQMKQIDSLREVPVIFLSAYTDTDDKLQGFAAGGVDFISKPFHFEEVNARVMAHLKIGRLQQRLAYQNEHLQELVDAKVRQLSQVHLSLLNERHQRDAAEREARQRLAEIAHMNRNASASVYCAALVHELNQPLAAILSNAEAAELFLARLPPALDDVREILADIRRDDRRAGELIQRMRELLKKSESKMIEVDLNQSVQDAATLLASEARARQVSLQLELAAAPLPVLADPVQLQQVLINLCLNGMDAMAEVSPASRQLTIRAGLASGAPVAGSVGQLKAQVTVQDSGSGFGASLGQVFESFFTTKPGGMGLGLSITAAIVEAHGGRVWAENYPSGGAVVRFTLPLASSPEPDWAPAALPALEPKA
jgi:signal transduction histidine kinase